MSTTNARRSGKPQAAETIIVVDADGGLKFLYHDDLAGLLNEGRAEIKRASHVEPDGTQWQADMSPVGGGVLGPFPTRREALNAEVAYLNEFYL